jgi:hypothetical protein
VPVRARRDEIRLPRAGARAGYTTRVEAALRSGWELEPEAISAEYERTLAARAARDRSTARLLRRAYLAAAPLDVRLRRIQAQARALKVDVHAQLRLARLAVEGGRPRAHIERRLATLEARLWPNLPA